MAILVALNGDAGADVDRLFFVDARGVLQALVIRLGVRHVHLLKHRVRARRWERVAEAAVHKRRHAEAGEERHLVDARRRERYMASGG